jgi:hypothetical protein
MTAAGSLLRTFGVQPRALYEWLYGWSLAAAGRQQELDDLLPLLRDVEPDLSAQYSRSTGAISRFQELKLRTLHAFQCRMMLEAIAPMTGRASMTAVDIGDSAGTHMRYLSALTNGYACIDAVSVNLDACAIEKIRTRGGKAMHCRAEALDLDGRPVDLFVSFEMVEHLHNPALFFYRLAKRGNGERLLITVPYRRSSQVGLQYVRAGERVEHHAEEVHVFELSPEDWSVLLLHSGWRVEHERTYLQYPTRIPIVSNALRRLWRRDDFEGFWGAIATRDLSFADCYQDWEP